MLNIIKSAAVLLALATALILPPEKAQADDEEGYSIGLWGDLPYSVDQENIGLPNLLADMNAAKLKFSVHDGDLKQGSGSLCNDDLYMRSLRWFNTLKSAAIFTPGDNDWTDCDRASNGAYNSLERLDRERQIFFSTNLSMGQKPMRQEVQTAALCLGLSGQVACRENRRWSVGSVMYVTLNVAGSCNNLCDTAPNTAEYAARNAANIQWLNETFAAAKRNKSAAVMLITQANPGWDLTDPTRASTRDPKTLAQTDTLPDGYKEFLLVLRQHVVDFRRPVVYVHGDSHYFRVDKPLLDAAGRRLENFTRVETFGNNAANGTNDVNWLKVRVDAESREVFTFEPMIVPGNRVAVVAP